MRKIGIFSAKGGVGKTTLTANLGAALTMDFCRDTILLDGNISDANLALHFGISYPHLTLDDVIKKRVKIDRAIYIDDYGIKIIPASLGKTAVNSRKVWFALRDLNGMCKILLIDTPPTTKGEVEAIMNIIDDVMVVTTPDIPSIAGCIKTISLAEDYNKRILGIVLNRVKKKNYEITKDEVESTVNEKVISIIPEDDNIPRSIVLQRPVVITSPWAPSAIKFVQLAAYLAGGDVSKFGFFWKLKRWFGFGLNLRGVENTGLEELRIRMGEGREIQEKVKEQKRLVAKKPQKQLRALEPKAVESVEPTTAESTKSANPAQPEHAEQASPPPKEQ